MIKSVGVVVVLGSSRTDQAGCQRKHRLVLLLTPPIIHLQHHGRCTLKHQVLNCDVLVPQVQSTFYIVEVPFLGVVPLGQCSVYCLQSKAGLLWDIQGTPGQCAQQREGVGLGQCSLYKCSCLGVGRPGLRRIEWLLPEPTLQSLLHCSTYTLLIKWLLRCHTLHLV